MDGLIKSFIDVLIRASMDELITDQDTIHELIRASMDVLTWASIDGLKKASMDRLIRASNDGYLTFSFQMEGKSHLHPEVGVTMVLNS
jgi:hypothetical protein